MPSKRDSAAAKAAAIFLSGKSKYTTKDLHRFSAATLNQIIAQSGHNTKIAKAAATALAGKNPKKKG